MILRVVGVFCFFFKKTNLNPIHVVELNIKWCHFGEELGTSILMFTGQSREKN